MPDPATVSAAAGVVGVTFSILSAGVAEVRKGDIKFNAPNGPVGVIAQNIPPNVGLTQIESAKRIFSYRSSAPAGEAVNVKLDCRILYDGPQVQANFELPADGMRSRFNSDVTIDIREPLSIQRLDAPEVWRNVGMMQFPVVKIPVSIFVDEPWPTDNTKITFNLVLSGVYGFGSSADGPYKADFVEHND